MRPAEFLKLHWTHERLLYADFDGRRPMFCLQPDAQKSNKAEILPMTPEFAEFLMQTPESEQDGYLFNPFSRRPQRINSGRMRLDSTSNVIVEIGKAQT
jgi:hypothetical protein